MEPIYDALLGKLLMHSHPDGGGAYTNPTPMPQAVGGWAAGSTFNAMPIEEVLDGLFYSYQYPAFTSFSIPGMAASGEAVMEIGAGAKTFVWSTTNGANVIANSVKIVDLTRAIVLAENMANDGAESIVITALTLSAHTQVNTWRISATNSKGQTFSRDFTIIAYLPSFHGVGAAGLSVGQIQQLTKVVGAKQSSRTLPFTTNTQKPYLAFPASFGDLTSIKDPNNFETLSGWTKRVEQFTTNGSFYIGPETNYNIYEFNNISTTVAFSYTFIF